MFHLENQESTTAVCSKFFFCLIITVCKLQTMCLKCYKTLFKFAFMLREMLHSLTREFLILNENTKQKKSKFIIFDLNNTIVWTVQKFISY